MVNENNNKKVIPNAKSLEFIQRLRKNDVKTPNEFTELVGEYVRYARMEKEWSQAEFAKMINRRPATISEIENGKSDISIQTLVTLAVVLEKPISYFFPTSLLKDVIMDVKSPFQHKALEMLNGIEFFGGEKMTLEILKVLVDNLEDEYNRSDNDFEEPG